MDSLFLRHSVQATHLAGQTRKKLGYSTVFELVWVKAMHAKAYELALWWETHAKVYELAWESVMSPIQQQRRDSGMDDWSAGVAAEHPKVVLSASK